MAMATAPKHFLMVLVIFNGLLEVVAVACHCCLKIDDATVMAMATVTAMTASHFLTVLIIFSTKLEVFVVFFVVGAIVLFIF